MLRKSLDLVQKELDFAFKNLDKAKAKNDKNKAKNLKIRIGTLKYIREILRTSSYFSRKMAEQEVKRQTKHGQGDKNADL